MFIAGIMQCLEIHPGPEGLPDLDNPICNLCREIIWPIKALDLARNDLSAALKKVDPDHSSIELQMEEAEILLTNLKTQDDVVRQLVKKVCIFKGLQPLLYLHFGVHF
jgi:hypothetical protein